MAVDTKKITEFAQRIRNADPSLYGQFIQLLDQYTTDVTVAVTEAPPQEILVAQGRAQMARKFMQLLTEFRALKPPTP